MLTLRCCASKPDGPKTFRMPKRLTRARRVAESKRMDTFREIHEALKKTAREETEFVKGFFKMDEASTTPDANTESDEEDS